MQNKLFVNDNEVFFCLFFVLIDDKIKIYSPNVKEFHEKSMYK